MRLLLIVHGFPPSACGGTEIYTSQFARAMARLPGMEVAVLAREADASRPEYSVRESRTPDGVAVYRINNTFQTCASFEDSYANPALAAVASEVMDDLDPQVVHAQHLTCLSTGLVAHASAARRAVVLTLNDYWLMCHRGQLLRADGSRCDGPFDGGCDGCVPRGALAGPLAYRAGRLARASGLPGAASVVRAAVAVRERVLPAAPAREASRARLEHMRAAVRPVDLVLAPSATMESWALRFGIEPSKLRRCDQGIDLEPFQGVTRTDGDRLRLAFAGSLIPSKAPHVLLEAVDALPAGRVSVDLLGAPAPYHGDAAYAERLGPWLGKPFVRTLGPVPHERMPGALARIDALVVPSVWIENAPFVIREAFAARAPVIASDLGGMAEMVRRDRDGLLFEPGSPRALGLQIARLLDDPALIERLRRGIRPSRSIEADAIATRAWYEELPLPRVRRVGSVSRTSAAPARHVGAVVLNYRTPDQTALATRSIAASTARATPLVVDNGSADGSVERLTSMLPGARIIANDRNLGFSAGCNVGIRAALEDGADLVLLVNSDAVLAPSALETLLAVAAANPRAGILAPVLLSREEPDRIASAGIRFSAKTGRMRHTGAGQPFASLPNAGPHRVDAVSGCVMLIRRELFARCGMLDPDFFFYFEDVELCARARKAGFDVLCVPAAIAYHEGGRSIGRSSPDRIYFAVRNHLRAARMVDGDHPAAWLRGGLIVGLNAGYVLLSGHTPRLAGFAALARGVWHHLQGRYGPA